MHYRVKKKRAPNARARRKPLVHHAHMDRAWFEMKMKEKGLRQEDVANLMGRDRTIVNRLLTGDIKEWNMVHVEGFHKAFDIPRAVIMQKAGMADDLGVANGKIEDGGKIVVKGFVQAGYWSESHELPSDEWTHVESHSAYDQYGQVVGVKVKGDSMDRVFPAETILIVCPIIDYKELIESGDFVVVLRRCSDGQMEWTLKEYRVIGDEIWLRPHSHNPRYQNIRLPDRDSRITIMDDGRQIDEVQVWGVVVGYHATQKPKAPDT